MTIHHPGTPSTAFASRDFRCFFAARLANFLGTNIMMPTLAWQVYALTRDPLSLGMIGMSVFIPVVLSSLFSGQLADRLERKRIYQVSQLLLLAAAASLLILSLAQASRVQYFYLAAALFGMAKTFSIPAASAWMPHLVPAAGYASAVAATSSAAQIASVAGPAISGALIAVAGEAATYAVASICYLTSLCIVTLVRTLSRGGDARAGGLAQLFSGFRYIFRNRLILGAVSLDLCAVLLGGATAMLPVFAHEILKVGEAGYGLMRAAPAVGATLTGLYLARRPLRTRVGKWLFMSVVVYGASILAFGASRLFVLSVLALLAIGAADTVGSFIRQMLIQLSTHNDMRGRVTSVNMMFVSARSELGSAQSGLVASIAGAGSAVMLSGVCALVVAGIWSRLFPSLRQADRFAAP